MLWLFGFRRRGFHVGLFRCDQVTRFGFALRTGWEPNSFHGDVVWTFLDVIGRFVEGLWKGFGTGWCEISCL